MNLKTIQFTIVICIAIAAAEIATATSLTNLADAGELNVEAFVNQFKAPPSLAAQLPGETVLQKRAAARHSSRSYPLKMLGAASEQPVTSFLEQFDGRDISQPPAPDSRLVQASDQGRSFTHTLTQDAEYQVAAVSSPVSVPVPGPKAKAPQHTAPAPAPALIADVQKNVVVSESKVVINEAANQPLLTVQVFDREHVSFEPAALVLQLSDGPASYQVIIEDGQQRPIALGAETSLFVRNEDLIGFNKSTRSLEAKAKGETEVYFVHHGKVHVLPVAVKASLAPDINAPEELFSLADVGQVPGHASFRANEKSSSSSAALKPPPVYDSEDDDAKVLAPQVSNDYYVQAREAEYLSATLKVVDQRSSRESSEIFPLSRISVAVAGIKYKGLTDRLGALTIDNLPSHSRLLLKFDDPLGRARATVKEIHTGDANQPLQVDIAMPLNRVMSTFEQVAGIVPDVSLATICGTVYDDRNNENSLANIDVAIDVDAVGPYYFNQFGYLDPAQGLTGEEGKFCFFNVLPGPVAFSFYQQNQLLSTQIDNAHQGRYQDLDFFASDAYPTSAHLAARVTAHEQLGANRLLANSLKAIDMIDVIPLGTGQSMTYLGEGVVGVVDGADLHGGRSFALAQAAEFEPVMYSLSGGDDNVLPLFPRGFVDDMSIYAQVPYHPDLGVIIAEHSDLQGQGAQPVQMRLEDMNGDAVGEGWYYDNKPATKAIFFNLQPGQYVLMVETEDGYWLAAETVFAFNETISYVRTGSPLLRKK